MIIAMISEGSCLSLCDFAETYLKTHLRYQLKGFYPADTIVGPKKDENFSEEFSDDTRPNIFLVFMDTRWDAHKVFDLGRTLLRQFPQSHIIWIGEECEIVNYRNAFPASPQSHVFKITDLPSIEKLIIQIDIVTEKIERHPVIN